MMKKIYFFMTMIVLLAQPAHALRHAEKLQYTPELYEGIKLFTEIDYRYNGDDIYYRHYDGGLRFPLPFLGEGWAGGLQFRATYDKSEDGSWDLEKRPHGQITKTLYSSEFKKIPELQWQFRVRHEYRIRENGNDTARNRLRLRIKSKDRYFGVKPFIGNEVFYDFDDDAWTKNWLIAGFDLPKFKYVKPSVYYKLVTDIDDAGNDYTSSVVFKFGF